MGGGRVGEVDGFRQEASKVTDIWVSIDGEEYTANEVIVLLEAELIERCYDSECPHNYHARVGIVDADLLVTLERRRAR